VDRQAILGGSAPGESYLWDPAPFVGENIGMHTVLGSKGNQGQSLPPNDGSWGLPSGICNHHKSRGAQGYTYYRKTQVILFIDTEASIWAIPFSLRPRSSKKITVRGILGQPLEHCFTQH
jgi:hypothetical protein